MARSSKAGGAAVAPVNLPPTEVHELPNGLRVLVATRRELPLVSVTLLLEAGASQDPAGREGLSAFTTELLRRGTERRAGDELDAVIERVGGRLDTDAGADAITLSASVTAENLAVAIDVVADVAVRPTFPAREFDAQRRRLLAELARNVDDPSAVADRSLLASLLPDGHPYGHPVNGTQRSVRALRREDVLRYHAAHFTPDRAVLIVVGDIAPAEVLALARRHFGRWKGTAGALRSVSAPPPPGRSRVRVIHKDASSQCQIRFVGRGFAAETDPDFFPAQIANGAFGGGFTSRLVDEIRVNRGLSYGARSRFAHLRGAGFFLFSSFTKNESIGELLAVALGEARKAREAGFRPDELERAKRYLAGLYPLRLETNEQVAGAIADRWLHGLPDDWVSRYRERLHAVSAEQAADVARRWFFGEPFSMVLVGDERAIRAGLGQAGVDADVEVRSIEAFE